MAREEQAILADGVFAEAPLQLVVAEVSFPSQDTSVQVGALDAIRSVLGQDASVELAPSLVRVDPSASEPQTALFRVSSKNATVAITAWRGALVLEHSDYLRWSDFRVLIESLAEGLVEVGAPSGVQRVGLRYVDEVHVPTQIEKVSDWAPYVDAAFLALPNWAAVSVAAITGAMALERGESITTNVRFATFTGRALNTGGPLRLRQRPETPAFLLDVDAVFAPPQVDPSGVVPRRLLEIFDTLHREADQVFDRAFTDEAKRVFQGGVGK